MVFMGKGTQQHNTCLKGDSELVGTYLGLQTIPEGFLRAATDGYPLQHLIPIPSPVIPFPTLRGDEFRAVSLKVSRMRRISPLTRLGKAVIA
jgi:hypothetical protein